MESEKDLSFFQNHIRDLMNRSEQENKPFCSDFLNETQRRIVAAIKNGFPRIGCCFFGGREDAERMAACFLPEGQEDSYDWSDTISCLKIELKVPHFAEEEAAGKVGHRDYLGALMGLNLVREKMGDVIVNPGAPYAYVFVRTDIADIVMDELHEVGAYGCSVSEIKWQEDFYQPSKKEAVISLSSMRLDSVVSRGFNLSRADGALAVKQKRIFVNGLEAGKGDMQLKIGDSVTFRGKGKIVLADLKGKSKSDRYQIIIEKYGK